MEDRYMIGIDFALGEDKAIITVMKDGKIINVKSYNESLPAEEQDKLIKDSKGGTWYDGWLPYCLTCSTNARMVRQSYGFRCSSCENMIGFHGYRLQESPVPPNVEYIRRDGSRVLRDLKKIKEYYDDQDPSHKS